MGRTGRDRTGRATFVPAARGRSGWRGAGGPQESGWGREGAFSVRDWTGQERSHAKPIVDSSVCP